MYRSVILFHDVELMQENWQKLIDVQRILSGTDSIVVTDRVCSVCLSYFTCWHTALNPLDSKGNYSATSNNTKLVHWPLMGGVLHLVQ